LLIGTANFAAGDEKDPPEADRQESAQRIGHKDLVHALIKALKDKEEDEAVRTNAAQALVGLGRRAVPSLIDLLNGKDNDLRIKAATILANMKAGEGQDAIPVLVKALKNKKEDKDFRRQATLALSQIVATKR
jgi:HEAT repeat protein